MRYLNIMREKMIKMTNKVMMLEVGNLTMMQEEQRISTTINLEIRLNLEEVEHLNSKS